MKLQGVFVPAATLFDHRGDLYRAKIHYNISRWNRTRVAGYVIGSGCGEARALSFDERRALWEESAKAADSEKLLLAGVSFDAVRETVQAIECARALGYKAAVVEPPQYPRPWMDDPRVQITHFRAVADQAKIPVLISNPRPGGFVRLAGDTILSLSRHPAIQGVMEASEEQHTIPNLLDKVPSGFSVLCGEDKLVYTALAAGATAVVPALANAAPFFCLSIEEAVRTRELSSAAELQQRADSAATAVTTQFGVAGLKYAMDLRGYYGGNPRLPLLPLAAEAKKQIETALAGINS